MVNPSKTNCFFNIPVKSGFAGNFRAHLELLQQRLRACQGHNPLQQIPCGAHARGRRASTSKSFQADLFFINCKLRLQKRLMKTYDLFKQKSRKSARALLLNPSNTHCPSTFLSNGASRANFARTSNSFDRFRAPATATIPVKKTVRGTCARRRVVVGMSKSFNNDRAHAKGYPNTGRVHV